MGYPPPGLGYYSEPSRAYGNGVNYSSYEHDDTDQLGVEGGDESLMAALQSIQKSMRGATINDPSTKTPVSQPPLNSTVNQPAVRSKRPSQSDSNLGINCGWMVLIFARN